MLAKFRQGISNRLTILVDGLEIILLLLGSGTAMVFGKVLAAIVFALLAIGVATRFFRRRTVVLALKPLPLWVSLVNGAIAVIGTAIVVEAINLPVRFDQAGFEKSNLLLVVAMLLAQYCISRAFFRRLLSERAGGNVVQE